MTDQLPSPKRIRRESISPPDEPEETALAHLRMQFDTLPQIAEAWLTGSRMTPEDGSPTYDTTDILFVLDPPLDPSGNKDDLRSQIEDLEHALAPTGYKSEPHRGWVFGREPPREAHARMIYRRSE